MEFLFDYIEKHVNENGSVSLHHWGDKERTKHYNTMNALYKPESPIMEYNGINYIVTKHSATSGRGGMDEGSPETFIVKKINLENKIKVKGGRPIPLKNPDFSSVIAMLEEVMKDVQDEHYHDDNDDKQYIWEEVMKVVYGKDIFDWWNKNVN